MDDNRNFPGCSGSPESSGPGMIEKAAQLAHQELTEAELREINKYTQTPLKAEDVFTFKAVLCDNAIDRDHERFSLRTLQDLQKLFQGKTVIKDHTWAADNQVARIYSTELVQSQKTAPGGELYTQLVAHCYMVRTDGNADLIKEIQGGIKKEGSIGCAVKSSICSICGVDNTKTYCAHWPGRTYEKDGHKQLCTYTLDGARDAYEFSLVAVPAQKAAGVSKSYTGKTVQEPLDAPETAKPGETPSNTTDSEKAAELAVQAELAAIRAKNTTTD